MSQTSSYPSITSSYPSKRDNYYLFLKFYPSNTCTGFPLFPKYQIPGFLKVLGPKFQFFSGLFVPNSRYFLTNFSHKNLEMCNQSSHLSGDMTSLCIFQVKGLKFQVKLASYHGVSVDKLDMTEVKDLFFCKWHLEK